MSYASPFRSIKKKSFSFGNGIKLFPESLRGPLRKLPTLIRKRLSRTTRNVTNDPALFIIDSLKSIHISNIRHPKPTFLRKEAP